MRNLIVARALHIENAQRIPVRHDRLAEIALRRLSAEVRAMQLREQRQTPAQLARSQPAAGFRQVRIFNRARPTVSRPRRNNLHQLPRVVDHAQRSARAFQQTSQALRRRLIYLLHIDAQLQLVARRSQQRRFRRLVLQRLHADRHLLVHQRSIATQALPPQCIPQQHAEEHQHHHQGQSNKRDLG